MTKLAGLTLGALASVLALAACATAPRTEAGRDDLKVRALEALGQMQADDPTLRAPFLEGSHGYVVFPEVGKGAYIVGGAYGRGIVYRRGAPIGYADITQATVGFQAGGQSYMELIAFESAGALERFTGGKFALTANLSAVIIKSGAAASATYSDGVAIFVKPIGGAMVEASIGAQQFTFRPQ